MQNYKSTPSRLVLMFRHERDNWKEKALERHKKIRALEIKARDLSTSRDNWKQRALEAEKELLKFLSKEGEKLPKK